MRVGPHTGLYSVFDRQRMARRRRHGWQRPTVWTTWARTGRPMPVWFFKVRVERHMGGQYRPGP